MSTTQTAKKSTTGRSPFKISAFRAAFQGLSTISPEIAARAAARLFIQPRQHRRPARELHLISSALQLKIPTRYGQLAAWSWGEEGAPMVLLVHGWEGRGAQLGAFVQPLLSAGYRVVAFDAPAHGHSPGRYAGAPHFARALRDVANHFGAPPYGIIAHSMGALATTMALRHGFETTRLVYIAPAGAPDQGIEQIREILNLSDEVIHRLKRQILSHEPMRWSELQHGAIPQPMTQPLLIIHDDQDKEVPLEIAKRVQERWSDAQLTVTSNLGHTRILRDEGVVERAIDFLTGTHAEERRVEIPWQQFLWGASFETAEAA